MTAEFAPRNKIPFAIDVDLNPYSEEYKWAFQLWAAKYRTETVRLVEMYPCADLKCDYLMDPCTSCLTVEILLGVRVGPPPNPSDYPPAPQS